MTARPARSPWLSTVKENQSSHQPSGSRFCDGRHFGIHRPTSREVMQTFKLAMHVSKWMSESSRANAIHGRERSLRNAKWPQERKARNSCYAVATMSKVFFSCSKFKTVSELQSLKKHKIDATNVFAWQSRHTITARFVSLDATQCTLLMKLTIEL